MAGLMVARKIVFRIKDFISFPFYLLTIISELRVRQLFYSLKMICVVFSYNEE